MKLSVALLLTCGTFVSGSASALCPRDHQIQSLHQGTALQGLRAIAATKRPGRPPAVAFYARLASEQDTSLWLHRCLDEACSPGTTSKLQTWAFFDGVPDVMLRADGRPLIANNYDGRAALFDCADTACTAGVNRPTPYSYGPLSTTAELRSNGLPVVAYVDQYARTIDLVLCEDAACTQTTREIVAPVPTQSLPQIQMAMTSDDRPVFAVSSFGDGMPFVDLVICESTTCDAPVTRRIADHYGYSLSIDLRSDDRPLVHFTPSIGAAKLVVCNDATCTSPHTQTLSGFISSGATVGPGDLPILEVSSLIVGYYDCTTETCSDQGPFQELATNQNGSSMAMAIGDNGEPFIAWRDVGQHTVTAATCADDVRLNSFEPMLDSTPVAAE